MAGPVVLNYLRRLQTCSGKAIRLVNGTLRKEIRQGNFNDWTINRLVDDLFDAVLIADHVKDLLAARDPHRPLGEELAKRYHDASEAVVRACQFVEDKVRFMASAGADDPQRRIVLDTTWDLVGVAYEGVLEATKYTNYTIAILETPTGA